MGVHDQNEKKLRADTAIGATAQIHIRPSLLLS